MDAAVQLVQSCGNCRLGITFRSSGNRQPLVYCDSDRGEDESRKSTADHILILAGDAWRSELRITTFHFSTCKAEIRAINAAKPAAVTALHIQQLLEEVLAHLPPVDIDPTEILLKLSTNFDNPLQVSTYRVYRINIKFFMFYLKV